MTFLLSTLTKPTASVSPMLMSFIYSLSPEYWPTGSISSSMGQYCAHHQVSAHILEPGWIYSACPKRFNPHFCSLKVVASYLFFFEGLMCESLYISHLTFFCLARTAGANGNAGWVPLTVMP